MEAIKVLRACVIARAPRKVGAVLLVPGDVSINEARLICKLKRAEETAKPRPKKAKADDQPSD